VADFLFTAVDGLRPDDDYYEASSLVILYKAPLLANACGKDKEGLGEITAEHMYSGQRPEDNPPTARGRGEHESKLIRSYKIKGWLINETAFI
jgi:hypothetical protein